MRRECRRGFSLIEVLVASTILLLSAVVLAELAAVGMSHARAAHEMATAQMLCQSKMNEFLAGVAHPQSVEDEPFEGVPGWLYSVEMESAGRFGLAQVRVTVGPEVEEGQTARRFSMTRWMHGVRASAAPAAERPPATPGDPLDPLAEPFDPGEFLPSDAFDEAWPPADEPGWEPPPPPDLPELP